jgi:hypothetical protein
MILLYKDVKAPVAKILNMDVSDARVLEHVNEACERIINLRDWANMDKPMNLIAYKGLITLPPEVIIPLWFNVNGTVGQPYGRHYEYLQNGPGEGESWNYTGKNLVDVGEYPTTYDVDNENPTNLVVWSDREEAADFRIRIRGLDENGLMIRSADGTVGEVIEWTGVEDDTGILDAATIPKVTTNKFSRILQVEKETGKGYIHLATADDDGNPANAISVYHPFETRPSYRRFRIFGTSQEDTDGFTLIKGIFRTGFTKVYLDDDPLPISAVTPIKLMVKAIWHYDHDEIQKAATLEGIVEREMNSITSRYNVHDNTIAVEDGYGMGDIESV